MGSTGVPLDTCPSSCHLRWNDRQKARSCVQVASASGEGRTPQKTPDDDPVEFDSSLAHGSGQWHEESSRGGEPWSCTVVSGLAEESLVLLAFAAAAKEGENQSWCLWRGGGLPGTPRLAAPAPGQDRQARSAGPRGKSRNPEPPRGVVRHSLCPPRGTESQRHPSRLFCVREPSQRGGGEPRG